ncbi:hypothetical protein PV05_07391 [Exophiala xenobiotica]|uniref:Zn(2)-C6 fungal-type domain-containing protein n=1 Tax=Exophiala xenobiotica TaxID=348802 RepID=A0A0D2F5E1_9EURO|nr:uncharacterized protein PV05_07391 [Exophiala xenobiotica]KIW55079.1 hypothetical protein PV05_07391 [Exophiala xenobiotica]
MTALNARHITKSKGTQECAMESPSRVEKLRRRHPREGFTRNVAACDACRQSKTRCDNARPSCAKCATNGVRCIYSAKDPISMVDAWGAKILAAVHRIDQRLAGGAPTSCSPLSHSLDKNEKHSDDDQVEVEMLSRNDSLRTCVTGADAILSWPIFPSEKPVSIFGTSAFSAKRDRFTPGTPSTNLNQLQSLRRLYVSNIHTKAPIIDLNQLDKFIFDVAGNGLHASANTCLVLLVCALAKIWGNSTCDDVYTQVIYDSATAAPRLHTSLAVPEDRMKESLSYFAAARDMMSAAYLDDSLTGIQCFCLFGYWYQCNIEPVQSWKFFRTASTLWQAYHAKHRQQPSSRSEKENSLEQRLYWTCLKTECELRTELPDLPSSCLWASDFPFSFPSFSKPTDTDQADGLETGDPDPTTASSFYYLAEISLRRLLNRIRNSLGSLNPRMSTPDIQKFSQALAKHEHQLQRWVECLPVALQFAMPLRLEPPSEEPELVQLLRERYTQAYELLRRPYLYLCLHAHLDPELLEISTQRANDCL